MKDWILQNNNGTVIENVISTASYNLICFCLIHTIAK